MKKSKLRVSYLSMLIISLTMLLLNVGITSKQVFAAPKELMLLNWADYMDPGIIKDFEQKYNAKVRLIYYETDELKDQMLAETNGSGYDVVVSAGVSVIAFVRRNWVAPMSGSEIPNIKHIEPRWLEAYPALKGYAAVPYFWGTLGIAYRQDLVQEKIKSWKQLFQPKEQFRKKIVMIKDSRETVGLALKCLGYSFNSIDPAQYEEAGRLLLSQKPFVREYSYVSWKEDSTLVSGECLMAMMYNGDALVVQEHRPEIVYVVPEEGTALWIDYLVVMNATKQRKLAFDFVNFISEPTNASRLSSALYFATPNAEARKKLSQKVLSNRLIYPDESVLKRSEFYQELPPRIQKKRNEIFSRIIQ